MAQAKTWSSNKHHNTIKFLIGISPIGNVSFISKAWGGRTSDKYIFEHCGILENILPGDYVMADRGFDVGDALAGRRATLIVPAYMKGKKQLSRDEVVTTRNIANVRIHVERVIGSVRQKFKILGGPIPMHYVMKKDSENLTTIDKIAVVSCALTNMCPSVVSFE